MNQTPLSRRPDWAALGVAAFLAVAAITILVDMTRLSVSTGYSQVGPATVPRWIAYVLLILSALTAIGAFRGRFASEKVQAPAAVFWIVLGLILQIVLLKSAGFTIATGLMFACVARGFDERRWHVSLPVGLVLSFCVFAVFSQLLRLTLPAGWLENLIF
ncbi:tripartite tricarboxylate transporter TctB family protein [Paracoccus sp. (in: a-proteobacteria)]|uniref:tripartite tricarboxylate transporter TctB family protein n=1 Tax=Paracoccus sp. TaxID=267 RepID=UPI00289F96A1|nr:tripartite tricarboxylate transporter TctB family protein [Paracoccus sp. (in: a-proteobacteria)]